jgi:hypothetical protein
MLRGPDLMRLRLREDRLSVHDYCRFWFGTFKRHPGLDTLPA